MMAVLRIRYGRLEKGHLHCGDQKDPVKGLELTAESCMNLDQEAEGSALESEEFVLEARRRCPR